MKSYAHIFLGMVLIGALKGEAQVTNLNVNRSGLTFTMASGDTIRWEYNVPTGGTTVCEFWFDVNANGIIEPGVDVQFATFKQTDGDASGTGGGPPDMDGAANGHVIFYQKVGLPAGQFLMKFTSNSVGQTATGTVTPLASPAHTITGHVSVQGGKSAQYILVELYPMNRHGSDVFWDAMTDAGGNFAVQMDADTAGNPWFLSILNNPYPPAIISPQETTLTIIGNPSGYNFNITAAAAQVAGYLRDEDGNPLLDKWVGVTTQNNSFYRSSRVNTDGFFQVGFTSEELALPGPWMLQSQSDGGPTTTEMMAYSTIPTIHAADSLFRILTVYKTNSTISGQVLVDGVPQFTSFWMIAYNGDTAQAQTFSSPGTGNFTIPVSNKIANYQVFPINLDYNHRVQNVIAHPGESGVIVNITTTGVDDRSGEKPAAFRLAQNYPNPFNPQTVISYDIAEISHVRLSVFNLLGQEVALLVNQTLSPGSYQATLDAGRLAGGVYFYRLSAGRLSETRKMLIAK